MKRKKKKKKKRISIVERALRGQKFEENGLWGLKDIDGSVIYGANYVFIGACKDYVLAITPDNTYIQESSCCRRCGHFNEKKRPFIANGKAGIMEDGEVIIPAEYDFIDTIFGDTVFYAIKDGKEMYLNHEGKEVLTRVRHFDREKGDYSPFWPSTNVLDVVTVMNYVGKKDDSNPNVVFINDQWVELERYSKDEIMEMLVEPSDSPAFKPNNLMLFRSESSYQYSFHVANAKGEHALGDCIEQFKKMNVFDNSWNYIVKIWQAPTEQISHDDLNEFIGSIEHNASKHDLCGRPFFAAGHCPNLNPTEVRVLLITFYNEDRWPRELDSEWENKCKTMPITNLLEETSALRDLIEETVPFSFQDIVFRQQISKCILYLEYVDGLQWEDAEKALNDFLRLGGTFMHSLLRYILRCVFTKNTMERHFFLKAANWVVENGDMVNDCGETRITPITALRKLKEIEFSDEMVAMIADLETKMLSKGAKTFKELEAEEQQYVEEWRKQHEQYCKW